MSVFLKRSGQKSKKAEEAGQMVIEYAVMFVVIVTVIIYASTTWLQPSINNFFSSTTKIIDNSKNRIEQTFN